jgi:hypothetical protein
MIFDDDTMNAAAGELDADFFANLAIAIGIVALLFWLFA